MNLLLIKFRFFSISNQEVLERRILNLFLLRKSEKEFLQTVNSEQFILSTFPRLFINLDSRIKTESRFLGKSSITLDREKYLLQFSDMRDSIVEKSMSVDFDDLMSKYL